MRVPTSLVVAFLAALAAVVPCGCGGGGDGGGGPPAVVSLFPAGVTAQDLVAASYVDRATGVPSLLLSDALGRGQIEVTDLAVDANGEIGDLVWSPDHSLLAVIADPDDVVQDLLFVVEPLSGTVRQVSGLQPAGSNVDSGVQWSPDSRFLAFRRSGVPGSPLFAVGADGTGLVDVSAPIVAGGIVFEFAWSPDSTKLAISMSAETVSAFEAFVVSRDGSGRVKVSGPTALASAGVADLGWSPDSTRIAYRGELDATAEAELYVSLATGVGGRTQVHPALTVGGDVFAFEWAPDGSRIAYLADQTTNNVVELFTSLPDGTGNVRVSGNLVAGGSVEMVDVLWAPDSSRLVYYADQTTDDVVVLFTALPDGSAPPIEVSGPMVAGGDVGGRLQSLGDVAWSPDASRIAYVADQEVDGQEEVYVTLPTAAAPVRITSSVVADGEVQSDLTWSDDSQRLRFDAEHRTAFFTEPFVSTVAGPAEVVVPTELGFLGDGDFSFRGDRLVFTFDPDGPGDVDLRSYQPQTLTEAIILTPPTPSDVEEVDIR
jgi:Tol biopolymer transport system component